MLNLLDESLEHFLRVVVPLPNRDIDVAFEAPDRDWAAGVSRPTINLYLWDVRPNTDEREFGMEDVTDGQRRIGRRSPRPRIDCRFLVTAWTSEVRDEHSLLGRVLVALLNNAVIAGEHCVVSSPRSTHRRGCNCGPAPAPTTPTSGRRWAGS